MVRACANASALQCIMMTALQIFEPVTRPRLVAPQYIALAFSGAISNPGALAAGVQGSKTPRRPLSAAALTKTYPPLPNITGILVDPSQLIRCELRSSVLRRPARTMERRRADCSLISLFAPGDTL